MPADPGLWTRVTNAFDRAFSAFANSGLIRMLSKTYATPELDVGLCLERLDREEPKQLVIGLQWLSTMTTPFTSHAAPRVLELTKHADEAVRAEANRTRRVLAERFGEPWR